MQETKPAKKAVSPVDRGETEAVMMPLTIGQTVPERAALSDQVVALVALVPIPTQPAARHRLSPS